MSVNAATILGGPALVKHRGATFYSKGNIALAPTHETFNIEVDRYGKVDERVSNHGLKVTFDPAGEWESLPVLWPYASTLLGSLIAPASTLVSAINTTSNELTATAHGLTTADAVLVHVDTGGTLPAATPALSNKTTYFVRVIDANTVTLHPTASDATGNTNVIDLTAAGTGNLYVDRDWPLVIHTFAGIKLTLFNAAVTRMPNISLSAVKTLIGTVEYEAFLRNGTEWSNATARWQITNEALSDTTFDPANIKTQPYVGAWGSAPWDAFDTKEGFEFSFPMQLDPVTDDSLGVVTRRLRSLEATLQAQPIGLDENQVLTKMALQDTGAVRGRSLSGDNLLVSGTGVFVQLYGAALKTSALNYSAAQDRVGQLEWAATRTFSAGVPNPLFYIGTTTP
jgi:hypothetical protein